jgi:hypothetical protein
MTQPKYSGRKGIFSFVWSHYDLHSRLAVPKGERHNSTFFVNVVIPGLQTNLCSETRRNMLNCWKAHLDNALVHKLNLSRETLEPTGPLECHIISIAPTERPMWSLKFSVTPRKMNSLWSTRTGWSDFAESLKTKYNTTRSDMINPGLTKHPQSLHSSFELLDLLWFWRGCDSTEHGHSGRSGWGGRSQKRWKKHNRRLCDSG